jgi:hypothetical protein
MLKKYKEYKKYFLFFIFYNQVNPTGIPNLMVLDTQQEFQI